MQKSELTVEAINDDLALVLLSDGSSVPMVDYYSDEQDSDGNFLQVEASEAKHVVAGEDGVGWFHIDLSAYKDIVIN